LVASAVVWVLRGRFSKGLGFVPRLLGWLAGKLGGAGKMEWWRTLRMEGGRGWEALGWNLVRMTQAGAVMFSAGLMAGLLGCIWFLEVAFFWESTTPEWMAGRIYDVCSILSSPWGWAWPEGRPSMVLVEASIWEDRLGVESYLSEGWYLFLFTSIFFWGLLPRAALWVIAFVKERSALGALDFQAKRHRELWRAVMGTQRADVSEAPRDGVLVLDVGGTGLRCEDLRGFMLRRMRANPGEWFEVGVWDGKGEAAAADSIRKAPAGVVLLAEGWALSPPQMRALHRQIRTLAGSETMIHFLVVNADPAGKPGGVKDGERLIWTDFVDSLADAAVDVYFHEEEGI
jgi:Protein of unknown function (DUF2868)